MRYFSYGSNMSHRRLKDRIGDVMKIGVFRLDRHDLRFHKKSKKDGSAKCDAYFTGSDEDFILGVLYEIRDSDKKDLDEFEGLGKGYKEEDVTVYAGDQTETAMTYIATMTEESLLPYSWYLRHVLEGAKAANFPAFYIEKLEKITSMTDPDPKREKKELSIYR